MCIFMRDNRIALCGIHKEEHMAIDYIALGQRFADFRSKKNLSQEELAFSCGVGNKHISNIELGIGSGRGVRQTVYKKIIC